VKIAGNQSFLTPESGPQNTKPNSTVISRGLILCRTCGQPFSAGDAIFVLSPNRQSKTGGSPLTVPAVNPNVRDSACANDRRRLTSKRTNDQQLLTLSHHQPGCQTGKSRNLLVNRTLRHRKRRDIFRGVMKRVPSGEFFLCQRFCKNNRINERRREHCSSAFFFRLFRGVSRVRWKVQLPLILRLLSKYRE